MPDAVLVCGGGLDSEGSLPPWVVRRFDRALEVSGGAPIVALSAGTVHKPAAALESVVGARYLMNKGYPRESVLFEASSYDTIGNAYFARTIHTDPAGFLDLCVITSDFHMLRTEAIFRWIFGTDYRLAFEATEPIGLDPSVLKARIAKEKTSLDALSPRFAELTSLAQIHRWLFTEHELYATGLRSTTPVDDVTLSTY